jgi:3-dehydroquinate synthase
MSASYSFEIASSLGAYLVRIGRGLAREQLSEQQAFMVSDAALPRHFAWLQRDRALLVEATEADKNLETVTRIIEAMRDAGTDRHGRMLAVGGGIIQDVSTAAASLYMRGVKWSYCPTTLLGMVDSCIGGKSSINVGRYKNIAGNFFPPQEVVIDTEFCESLPVTQRIAGLCEAAKICFANRDEAFETYLQLAQRADLLDSVDALTPIIALSLQTKKAFIEEDEFDQGVRLLLNFGHTFGHAIEAATHFEISHGVAVGLGMLAARDFSIESGWVAPDQPRGLQLVAHVKALLSAVPGLREPMSGMSPDDALARFRLDKKHRQSEFAVIGLDDDGKLVRRFVPRDADTESLIRTVFARLPQSLAA